MNCCFRIAQVDDPLAEIDLEPEQYARLKRAARKTRCSVADFIRLGITLHLPKLEQSIAGGECGQGVGYECVL